jgi:linoleoyl-CoA desaturase
MVIKTAVIFAAFLTPYFLMITGTVTSVPGIALCWLGMGFAMAGIGLCIMHDSVHGSYSKNKTLNKILGLSMNIIGANAYVWKVQHNVLHHSYTNIAHGDDDIVTPPILRFSPHQKRLGIHKFQHIYVWFFYSLSTIFWVTTKDFAQLKSYWVRGLIKDRKEFNLQLFNILLWKVIYYAYIMVIPLMLVDIHWGYMVGMFIGMHMIAGLALALIFQPAHVISTAEFVNQESDEIQQNWAVHQLLTTTNFAQNNKVFTWLVGGLNYQVEHHLFPNICHIHFHNISPIVQETAKEFGIPYFTKKTYWAALKDHVKTLKRLGHEDHPAPERPKYKRVLEAA